MASLTHPPSAMLVGVLPRGGLRIVRMVHLLSRRGFPGFSAVRCVVIAFDKPAERSGEHANASENRDELTHGHLHDLAI